MFFERLPHLSTSHIFLIIDKDSRVIKLAIVKENQTVSQNCSELMSKNLRLASLAGSILWFGLVSDLEALVDDCKTISEFNAGVEASPVFSSLDSPAESLLPGNTEESTEGRKMIDSNFYILCLTYSLITYSAVFYLNMYFFQKSTIPPQIQKYISYTHKAEVYFSRF